MKEIIDNFSAGASEYALYRPESPKSVFDFLYAHVKDFNTAWDCGTGNGQVALKLSERFTNVYGTDISIDQLQQAPKKENIAYVQERAEHTSLSDQSVDLITVAQAIHWFDFDNFYTEVHRVAKPGALIAVWTYSLLRLTPEVNKIIDHLYWEITRPYWDKERGYVDDEYRTLPFPFEEIRVPELQIIRQYTFPQLLGYLRTWSGLKHYITKTGNDPVLPVMDDLEKAWGGSKELQVSWPVHMRAGRVNT
jgi:SAM-dependent methyltransferase